MPEPPPPTANRQNQDQDTCTCTPAPCSIPVHARACKHACPAAAAMIASHSNSAAARLDRPPELRAVRRGAVADRARMPPLLALARRAVQTGNVTDVERLGEAFERAPEHEREGLLVHEPGVLRLLVGVFHAPGLLPPNLLEDASARCRAYATSLLHEMSLGMENAAVMGRMDEVIELAMSATTQGPLLTTREGGLAIIGNMAVVPEHHFRLLRTSGLVDMLMQVVSKSSNSKIMRDFASQGICNIATSATYGNLALCAGKEVETMFRIPGLVDLMLGFMRGENPPSTTVRENAARFFAKLSQNVSNREPLYRTPNLVDLLISNLVPSRDQATRHFSLTTLEALSSWPANKDSMLTEPLVHALVSVLEESADNSDDLQELALAVLSHLANHHPRNSAALAKRKDIQRVVPHFLFEGPPPSTMAMGANFLEKLASNPANHNVMFGQTAVFDVLIGIVDFVHGSAIARATALRALTSLAQSVNVRQRMLQGHKLLSVVKKVILNKEQRNIALIVSALQLLSALAAFPANAARLIQAPWLLNKLSLFLSELSAEMKEQAVNLLITLAVADPASNVAVIRSLPNLMNLLNALTERGSNADLVLRSTWLVHFVLKWTPPSSERRNAPPPPPREGALLIITDGPCSGMFALCVGNHEGGGGDTSMVRVSLRVPYCPLPPEGTPARAVYDEFSLAPFSLPVLHVQEVKARAVVEQRWIDPPLTVKNLEMALHGVVEVELPTLHGLALARLPVSHQTTEFADLIVRGLRFLTPFAVEVCALVMWPVRHLDNDLKVLHDALGVPVGAGQRQEGGNAQVARLIQDVVRARALRASMQADVQRVRDENQAAQERVNATKSSVASLKLALDATTSEVRNREKLLSKGRAKAKERSELMARLSALRDLVSTTQEHVAALIQARHEEANRLAAKVAEMREATAMVESEMAVVRWQLEEARAWGAITATRIAEAEAQTKPPATPPAAATTTAGTLEDECIVCMTNIAADGVVLLLPCACTRLCEACVFDYAPNAGTAVRWEPTRVKARSGLRLDQESAYFLCPNCNQSVSTIMSDRGFEAQLNAGPEGAPCVLGGVVLDPTPRHRKYGWTISPIHTNKSRSSTLARTVMSPASDE